jgi:hypothetical protein
MKMTETNSENDEYRLTILPSDIYKLQSPILTPILNNENNVDKCIQLLEFNKKSIYIPISNFSIKVIELKNIINKKLDYPIDHIQLYYNEKYIENSQSLLDYNITYKSIIHIVMKHDIFKNNWKDYFIINVN